MGRHSKGIELVKHKKTGLWETRYPATGARQRRVKKWGTKDGVIAQQRHDAFAEQLTRGTATNFDATFDMLAEDYFAFIARNRRTAVDRQKKWDRHLQPNFGHLIAASTTENQVNDIFEKIRTRKAKVNYRNAKHSRISDAPLGDGTMLDLQTVFNAILNHAVKITKRLSGSLKPQLVWGDRPEKIYRAWSDHDAYTRILGKAEETGQRMFLFTALGLYTGQRSNIIYRLTWGHVDFHGQIIRAKQLKAVKQHRKDRKNVPDSHIGPELYEILYDAYTALDNPQPDDLIVGGSALGSKFTKMVKGLGLDGSPHWMRHTYVTTALRAGQSVAKVAEAVGDKISTIEAVYQHLGLGDTVEVAHSLPRRGETTPPGATPPPPPASRKRPEKSPHLRRVK